MNDTVRPYLDSIALDIKYQEKNNKNNLMMNIS